MAIVTYIPRMLPLTFMRRKIQNRFIRSFLYYVPYAVLAAMTLPGILYSTANVVSAITGMAAAIFLAKETAGARIATSSFRRCGYGPHCGRGPGYSRRSFWRKRRASAAVSPEKARLQTIWICRERHDQTEILKGGCPLHFLLDHDAPRRIPLFDCLQFPYSGTAFSGICDYSKAPASCASKAVKP